MRCRQKHPDAAVAQSGHRQRDGGATLLARHHTRQVSLPHAIPRQIDRYRQYGLRLPAATVSGWYEAAVDSSSPALQAVAGKGHGQPIHTDRRVPCPLWTTTRHRTRKSGYQCCVPRPASPSTVLLVRPWFPDRKIPPRTPRGLPAARSKAAATEPMTSSAALRRQWRGLLGFIMRRKFVEALREDRSLATSHPSRSGQLCAVGEKSATLQ